MLEAISSISIGGQIFVGFSGFAGVVTLVGLLMLRHYAKKEASGS